MADFAEPAVAIIKHTNPCCFAARADLAEVFELAFAAIRLGAFGGIVAINRPVDARSRHEAPTSGQRLFVEIIIAPSFSEAVEQLSKPKACACWTDAPLPTCGLAAPALGRGGMLVQEYDGSRIGPAGADGPVEAAADPAEIADMKFAWTCCKHVKSNAVVVAKKRARLASAPVRRTG